jgi:hypothetical protein
MDREIALPAQYHLALVMMDLGFYAQATRSPSGTPAGHELKPSTGCEIRISHYDAAHEAKCLLWVAQFIESRYRQLFR